MTPAFFRRARAVAFKELLHMARDARVIYLALGLPVLMLLLFGYAVSFDIDRIPLGVVDQDDTRASRDLAEALVAGGAFHREATLRSSEEADPLLRRGRVKAVLVVPRGYQRDRTRGAPGGAQLLLDGSEGTTATIALGDAAGIAQRASFVARGALARPSLSEGPAIRTRFNSAMRSAYAIVPGVIAIILSMVSALLSALAVAREWESGSMEQLFATPVQRSEIILGKLIPYVGLGLVQTLLVLTLGSYMFDVPIVGPVAMLFGASLLFLLGMLGFGLFVSAATKSQIVSVQLALTASMLPSMLLSGFLFPIENMPWWLQRISMFVPARYYITALRGVLLKGNGLRVLAAEMASLALFAGAMLLLAVVRFRRRLD